MTDAVMALRDGRRLGYATYCFRPEDVAVRTEVWHGTADQLVPSSWGEELARRLPPGKLVAIEGGDHMIGITRRADVLRSLAP